MRREQFDHPSLGCVGDMLANQSSKKSMKLLEIIMQEFFGEEFSHAELEEAVPSKYLQGFDYLCHEGIIVENDNLYCLNHGHPVLAAQSGSLGDIFEED